MRFLSVDIESRSTVDLRKTGVYPYAAHPTTDVWCIAYAVDDGEVEVWVPGDPVPGVFAEAVEAGAEFRAWNAAFERIMFALLISPRYGFPQIPRDLWVDTAAEAAAMALPRALGNCAKVMGITEQKDQGGRRLMLQMAKPRKARKGEDPRIIYWWDEEPEKLQRLIDYCIVDVKVERALAERLRALSEYEMRVYHLDQKVNDRGVKLDMELVDALIELADEAVERANVRLQDLTKGGVTAVTNVAEIKEWVEAQGQELDDLRKQTVAELLETGELDEAVREVLLTRSEAGKTSTSKLHSMRHCSMSDDRARGLLLYHGANTGRWSGRLIQPQNFPRPMEWHVDDCATNLGGKCDCIGVAAFIPLVLAGEYDAIEAQAPVMHVVSSLLRACFIPDDGHRFMCADFSSIESYVAAWVSGQSFVLSYEEMAGHIYGIDPSEVLKDSIERMVGKVAVLACCFGMGVAKYIDTVKDWTGLDIHEPDTCGGCARKLAGKRTFTPDHSCTGALAVNTFRGVNSLIANTWGELEAAAIRAVLEPGSVQRAGRNGAVRFAVRGQFLWCVLPSGRPLAYALPKVEKRMTPWGEKKPCVTVMKESSYGRKWKREALYGGLLMENVVQASARDLLADALLRAEREGYRPVLTVHDEILNETPEDHPGTLDDFINLMTEKPSWAAHMTVKADGWTGERYRK